MQPYARTVHIGKAQEYQHVQCHLKSFPELNIWDEHRMTLGVFTLYDILRISLHTHESVSRSYLIRPQVDSACTLGAMSCSRLHGVGSKICVLYGLSLLFWLIILHHIHANASYRN